VIVKHDCRQRTEYKPGTREIREDEIEVDQPFSCHLTKRQQDWIEGQEKNTLDRKQLISDRVRIQGAVKWFKEAQSKNGATIIASDECRG
jgi:hypothetical protein